MKGHRLLHTVPYLQNLLEEKIDLWSPLYKKSCMPALAPSL